MSLTSQVWTGLNTYGHSFHPSASGDLFCKHTHVLPLCYDTLCPLGRSPYIFYIHRYLKQEFVDVNLKYLSSFASCSNCTLKIPALNSSFRKNFHLFQLLISAYFKVVGTEVIVWCTRNKQSSICFVELTFLNKYKSSSFFQLVSELLGL